MKTKPDITIRKLAVGWIVFTPDYEGKIGEILGAFNDLNDLSAWLEEYYFFQDDEK